MVSDIANSMKIFKNCANFVPRDKIISLKRATINLHSETRMTHAES
jgi:hypothetical protein